MFEVAPLPRTLAACEVDLGHDDPRIRLSVLKDLARSAPEEERRARIDLLTRALRDINADVRRQALVSLADCGAREAADDVLPLLRDVEIKVRQMAVMCLGELALPTDEAIIGRLASLLRAGDASVRYQSLLAHSQLVPESASADLAVALSDSDAEVRELALRLVDEVLVAGRLEIPASLEAGIVAACADESPHVRLQAQVLAAERGWDTPHDALLAAVGKRLRVREPRDEQRALVGAGRLRLAAATSDLERRAFGRFSMSFDAFRWVALGALGRMGHERALAKLRSSLRARSLSERTAAVEALGEAADGAAITLLEALRNHPERVDQETLETALERITLALGATGTGTR